MFYTYNILGTLATALEDLHTAVLQWNIKCNTEIIPSEIKV